MSQKISRVNKIFILIVVVLMMISGIYAAISPFLSLPKTVTNMVDIIGMILGSIILVYFGITLLSGAFYIVFFAIKTNWKEKLKILLYGLFILHFLFLVFVIYGIFQFLKFSFEFYFGYEKIPGEFINAIETTGLFIFCWLITGVVLYICKKLRYFYYSLFAAFF